MTNGAQPIHGVLYSRVKLVPFNEIKLGTKRRYLVRGIIPRIGLTVVWGPPKSGKSFWTFDLMMHVALGWEYRGRRVDQGPVVYCAFEGQTGIEARVEAFRQHHLDSKEVGIVAFYLEPITLDLVRDHLAVIATIRTTLGKVKPVAVVLDTLNRSIRGSENSDEDMSNYVKAADAIREVFECAVVIVHHCGIDGTRPRGHTSLTGVADAQLSVKRDAAKHVIVELECAKDGPEGEQIVSRLEQVAVGTDEDGEPITSCVVIPADPPPASKVANDRLTPDQRTMFSLLHAAGAGGLSVEAWNEKAREVGIGARRKATLYDIRNALKGKGLIIETIHGWTVRQPPPF